MSFLFPHHAAAVSAMQKNNPPPSRIPGTSLTPDTDPAVIGQAAARDASTRAALSEGGLSSTILTSPSGVDNTLARFGRIMLGR